jgi:hypothetical protein
MNLAHVKQELLYVALASMHTQRSIAAHIISTVTGCGCWLLNRSTTGGEVVLTQLCTALSAAACAGADDQPYVVKVYPYAVSAALLQLGRSGLLRLGLPGVWWGLVGYYLVLLAGFGGRFFVFRARI